MEALEGDFGWCKLRRNGKENIIGRINFDGFMTKVQLSTYKNNSNIQLRLKFSIRNLHIFTCQLRDVR